MLHFVLQRSSCNYNVVNKNHLHNFKQSILQTPGRSSFHLPCRRIRGVITSQVTSQRVNIQIWAPDWNKLNPSASVVRPTVHCSFIQWHCILLNLEVSNIKVPQWRQQSPLTPHPPQQAPWWGPMGTSKRRSHVSLSSTGWHACLCPVTVE